MTGAASRRHRGSGRFSIYEADDELEMTPMIDMTFLLLIFFMVTSSVTPLARLELPPSQTGRAEEADQRVVLIVDFPEPLEVGEAELGGARFITLADTKIYFAEDPDRRLAPQNIETELRVALGRKPGSRFILQANRRMPVGIVRKLLLSAADAGATETLVGVTMPR